MAVGQAAADHVAVVARDHGVETLWRSKRATGVRGAGVKCDRHGFAIAWTDRIAGIKNMDSAVAADHDSRLADWESPDIAIGGIDLRGGRECPATVCRTCKVQVGRCQMRHAVAMVRVLVLGRWQDATANFV